MSTTLNYRFVMRRAIAAVWTAANDVLLQGEWGYETDTGRLKIGDGTTGWNSLRYSTSAHGALGCTFDGGGSDIAVGSECDVIAPFGWVVIGAYLVADGLGSMQVAVWSDIWGNYPPTSADSITGSSPLTLSGADHSADETLTGWTLVGTEGSTLRFHVVSCSAIKRATVILKVIKS